MHRWQWAARIWVQRHSWWCRLAAWTARVPWGEWRRCWKPRSSAHGNSQFSQALTQGRKLTGSRNIEERKRTSSCSACGAFGHWAGDNECPKSGLKGARGKPQGKGNGKEGNQGKDGKVSSADDKCAKRVYFTMQSEHGEQQQAVPADTQDKPFFITFAIHYHVPSFQMPAILFTQWSSLAGMMVLDTACQRMRCGRQWLEAHSELLAKHRLQPDMISISEAFQFGHGEPMPAKDRAYMPSKIGSVHLFWGASVVDTSFPLLATNTVLETGVINLARQKVWFGALGIEADIHKVHGHLAVSIADFESIVSSLPIWKELSTSELWNSPHPECTLHVTQSNAQHHSSQVPGAYSVRDVAPHTAQMDPNGWWDGTTWSRRFSIWNCKLSSGCPHVSVGHERSFLVDALGVLHDHDKIWQRRYHWRPWEIEATQSGKDTPTYTGRSRPVSCVTWKQSIGLAGSRRSSLPLPSSSSILPTSRTTQSKSKARLTSSHLLLSHQTLRNPSQAFGEELPVPEVFQMDFEDTGSQDLNYEWEHQG